MLLKESCQFQGQLHHGAVGVERWRFPSAVIKANRGSVRVQPRGLRHQLLQQHRLGPGTTTEHTLNTLLTRQSDYKGTQSTAGQGRAGQEEKIRSTAENTQLYHTSECKRCKAGFLTCTEVV